MSSNHQNGKRSDFTQFFHAAEINKTLNEKTKQEYAQGPLPCENKAD